jgi:hypothetical protein
VPRNRPHSSPSKFLTYSLFMTSRVPAVLVWGNSRNVNIFFINCYCPKAYHRPDHSIRIVEHYRKKIINIIIPKSNIFTETLTQDNIRICGLSSCNFFAQANNSIVLGFRATEIIFIGTRTQDSLFAVVTFVSVISSPLWSSVVLSFRATGMSSAGLELSTSVNLLKSLPGLKE